MYNQAVDNEELARAICESVREVDPEMIVVALAGSRWVEVAHEMGVRVGREIFADRALNPDGTLVSRSKPGSVLHDVDEVAERSVRMVTEGLATAITGEVIEVEAESLCIHGDTPGAVQMAAAVKRGLEDAGVSPSLRWRSSCSRGRPASLRLRRCTILPSSSQPATGRLSLRSAR